MGYGKKKRGYSELESFSSILGNTFSKTGIARDMERYGFVLHWEKIVGSEVAKRTKPEYIRKDALVVRVCDSAWAQELTFQKEEILKNLQPYLKEREVVDNLFFIVGDIGK